MLGSFQVFISYARKDNESPKDAPELKGSVTFLQECLSDELTDLGASEVKLWRDKDNIDDTDPFTPILEKQILNSSIMIVVMSPNWLARPYCRMEVEKFAERWSGDGEEAVRNRLKVVRKRPNDRQSWPRWLQDQAGLAFYSDDHSNANGLEVGYFWRGKVRDETYHVKVRDLAGVLSREAAVQATRLGPDNGVVVDPASDRGAAGTVGRPSPKSACALQTIFVARPATDMRVAYDRVVHELTGRGYAVVPETDIPADETAVEFVDALLAGASMSVHLLGAKKGYTPQDVAPIATLQLGRAAKRADDGPAPPKALARAGAQSQFRRIVWSPKVLDADTANLAVAVERDPLTVLSTFSDKLATDKIDGQGLSKFIDYLLQIVSADENSRFRSEVHTRSRAKIYLYREREDETFAVEVANALSARKLEPLIAITDGPPQDVKALHKRRLAECDAVALCWANAPQIKLSAKSNELKDWRQLKRAKQFAYRGLIVGPPPNQDKKNSKFHFPTDEIDTLLDLSDPKGDWGASSTRWCRAIAPWGLDDRRRRALSRKAVHRTAALRLCRSRLLLRPRGSELRALPADRRQRVCCGDR